MQDDDYSSIQRLIAKAPTHIGRYKIIDLVGQGGMGKVYRAYDPDLSRIVALKVISWSAEKYLQRKTILKEARTTARLNHPNIVKIYEVGEDNRYYYLAMEYIAGATLGDFIKDNDPSIKWCVDILWKIAKAIHYAHREKIIHRDLKPANIMIVNKTIPIVMDFGLAKDLDTETSASSKGKMIGTLHYMSPEQVQTRSIDKRSDIFGLGSVFYEMLTRQKTFSGRTSLEVAMNITSQAPKEPRKINANIPVEIQSICLKCLNKKRDKRYSSCYLLAADIQKYLQCRPVSAHRSSPTYRMAKWSRRNISIIKKMMVFLLVIVFVGSVLILRNKIYVLEKKLRQNTTSVKISQCKSDRNFSHQTAIKTNFTKSYVVGQSRHTTRHSPMMFVAQHNFSSNAKTQKNMPYRMDTKTLTQTGHYPASLPLKEDISPFVSAKLISQMWIELARTKTHQTIDSALKKILIKYHPSPIMYLEWGKMYFWCALHDLRQCQFCFNKSLYYWIQAGNFPKLKDKVSLAGYQLCHYYFASAKQSKFLENLRNSSIGRHLLLLERQISRAEKQSIPRKRKEIYQSLLLRSQKFLKQYEHSYAYRLQAQVYYALNRYDKAYKSIKKALAMITQDCDIKFHHPRRHYCGKAMNLTSPGYLESLKWKGAILSKKNKRNEAIISFSKVLECAPFDSVALLQRAKNYYKLGRFVLAIADLRIAMLINTDNIAVCYKIRGNCYLNCHYYQRACQDFSRLIEMHPKKSKFYLLRAMSLQKQNRLQDALHDVNFAIKLEPHNPKNYLHLSHIHRMLKQDRNALDDLKKAAKQYSHIMLKKN